MSQIPGATRKAVVDRDFARCVRCAAMHTEMQHRVRRREGGHRKSNLICMCHTCHQTWAHANPKEARLAGIVVPTWADPTRIPVKTWRGWVLLDDDGGMEFLTAEEATELLEVSYG